MPRGHSPFHFGRATLNGSLLDDDGRKPRSAECSTSRAARRTTALIKSDFADGCPIASVAVDAAVCEPIRVACANVFVRWRYVVREHLVADGWLDDYANAFSAFALSALEGAIVLAKTERTIEPLMLCADYVIGCAADAGSRA